jgi:hypothetical protein
MAETGRFVPRLLKSATKPLDPAMELSGRSNKRIAGTTPKATEPLGFHQTSPQKI